MSQRTVVLDTGKIEKIIALGEFDRDIEIKAESTLLVLDCQRYRIKNVKSIIFDIHKGICLSNYETRKLVNRFVEQNAVTFAFTRVFMQYRELTGALPYVYGEVLMIPLSGATQHSTNWFFLNNVSSHIFSSEGDKIILNCEKVFNVAVKIIVETKRSFCKHVIEIAYSLYEFQHQLSMKIAADHYPESPQAAAFYAIDGHHMISDEFLNFIDFYHRQFIKDLLRSQGFTNPSEQLINEVYTDVSRRLNRLT